MGGKQSGQVVGDYYKHQEKYHHNEVGMWMKRKGQFERYFWKSNQ